MFGTIDILTGEFFDGGVWGRGNVLCIVGVFIIIIIIIMAVLGLHCSACVSYMILIPPPGIELVSPALEGGFLY